TSLPSPAMPESVPAPSPRRLAAWLPTLLWLGVLAFFSTDTFSAEHTGSILLRIIHALYGPVSHHRFAQIHFLVRKGAHFFSYGLLSAFAFVTWRAAWPAPQRWHMRWAVLGLLTAF